MKINLNELKYIIFESYKQLLNEISVIDAYGRFYQDIPEDEYKEILASLQGDNDTLLPETKWALGLRKKNSPRFMEDLYKLHNENGEGYLDIFKRAKERRMISGVQADLNQYKSIADLGKFIGSLDFEKIMGRTKGEMSNAVHAAKDDIKLLYEDDVWKILTPLTHEASCYWAQGAEWCTACRDNNYMFDKYTKLGPLYMMVNKNDVEYSIQFHIPTKQYRDYYDQPIYKPILYNENPKLLDALKHICDEYSFIKLTGINIENGHRIAIDNNDEYFGILDENGHAITDMEYHELEPTKIPNLLIAVKVINNIWKYTLINWDGKILFKEWYDGIWFERDGIMVKKFTETRRLPSYDEWMYPSSTEDINMYNKYTLDANELKGEWTEDYYEALEY